MDFADYDSVKSSYDLVLENYEDIPTTLIDQVHDLQRPSWDYITPMRMGKEWTLEPMREAQPLTWAALMRGSDLRLAHESRGGRSSQILFLVVDGMVVLIGRDFAGKNPDDAGYRDWMQIRRGALLRRLGYHVEPVQRSLSVPTPVRLAYYSRIDGLSLPRQMPPGIASRLLPRGINRWHSVDLHLAELRLKKKYLSLVEELIPGIRPEEKDEPYTNFMLFLDSRPLMSGLEGDVFFVKNHVQDGIVYYVRDSDFPRMMILDDAGQAIDRYCAHILAGSDDRFDFRPFARPFAGG